MSSESEKTEANRALAVKFLTLLGNDKMKEAFDMMGDNGVWWTTARTQTPEQLLTGYEAVRKHLKGPIEIYIDGTTAEGDRVAVEAHSRAERINGAIYQNHYHFLFHIRGNQFTEIREHNDTHHAAQIFGDLA